MKSFGLFILISTLVFITGCGEQPSTREEAQIGEQEESFRTLILVDSIGVELGDSNYVWGSIEVVTHTADGNILAMDRPACCVREFTPEGEFVRQFGRRGTGPGELVNPMSMARVSDGRVAILDMGTGGLHTFMPNGEWECLSAQITNEPPLWMTPADGNGYVAIYNEWDFIDDEFVVTAMVTRFEVDSPDPVVIYWQNSFPWDPTDLTALVKGSYFANTWTSDREGHVFLAPRDPDEYIITGFTTEGEQFVEITMDLDKVEKSQLEIDEEAEFWNRRAENMGANGPFNYQPDPYRWKIHSMGIDGEGRLWVRRGTEETPTFDVFDFEGNHLFIARVPAISGSRGLLWEILVDEFGILAYSLDPVDGYQKLYVLDFEE